MSDFASEVFLNLCESVNTPKSLGCWLRLRDAPLELANVEIDPLSYNDAATFFADYAVCSFLKKYEGLETGVDTEAVALLGFRQSEEKCEETNKLSLSYATTGQFGQIEPATVARVQELIAWVWGDPTFSDLFDRCKWGPGSTASLTGHSATSESKMSELPMSVTPSALPFLRQVQKNDLAWLRHLTKMDVEGPACLVPQCYNPIDYSRLLTVPKNAKTDRVIAAEPTGNVFLQLGVGNYLKSRLRVVGIDLSDQQRNQNLASIAASHGLATLDLKAASDTISIGLCRVLLPPRMFELLDAIRSPAYKRLGGETVRFHKFSSMGNGFTFQLESLIFWAIAKTAREISECRGPISVYGDDIIVPQASVYHAIRILEGFGFDVNGDKSYTSGRFFESCGKHYFDNMDVTPVYQKYVVDGPLEKARTINRVFDLAYRRPFLSSERVFGRVHTRLLYNLPPILKKVLAPGFVQGDGIIHVLNWTGKRCIHRGIQIKYLKASPARQFLADGGLYAYRLRSNSLSVRNQFIPGVQPEGVTSSQVLHELLKVGGNPPTKGLVTRRPFERATQFTLGKRWVSCSFGTSSPGIGLS